MEYLFIQELDGRNESLTDEIEKALNRKPTSFDEYVVKTKQTRVRNVQNKTYIHGNII